MASLCSEGNLSYPVSHTFLNKITVIVGNCDILDELLEGQIDVSLCSNRIAAIRAAAKEMADEVTKLKTEPFR